MRCQPTRQRGFVMAMVIVTLAVVVGTLSLLAVFAAARYREVRVERIRQAGHAALDSAARLASSRLDKWAADPPSQPVDLDIAALLPPGMTGSATVTAVSDQDRVKFQLAVRVDDGSYEVGDQIELATRQAGPAGTRTTRPANTQTAASLGPETAPSR
jgi:hypothetical protein